MKIQVDFMQTHFTAEAVTLNDMKILGRIRHLVKQLEHQKNVSKIENLTKKYRETLNICENRVIIREVLLGFWRKSQKVGEAKKDGKVSKILFGM